MSNFGPFNNDIKELTASINKSPTCLLFIKRAGLFHILELRAEALADIREAIKLAQDEKEKGFACYVQAVIFEGMGQREQTKLSLEAAIRLGFKPDTRAIEDNFSRLKIVCGLEIAGPKIPSIFVSPRQKTKHGLPER